MMLKLDSCLQIWSPMFIILSDFRFQQKNLFCMFLCIIRKYNIFWPQWRKLDPKDSYRPHVVMQTWIQQSFLNLSDFRFEQKKVLYVAVHISKIKLFLPQWKKLDPEKKSCKPGVVIQNYTLRSIKKQS